MSCASDVEPTPTSPTKSDEFCETDFVVVDEVDNIGDPNSTSPPATGDNSSSEFAVDANSNLTTPRVYRRREKKVLALSLIDDIALQSGTSRKSVGSVADKLTPGRGDSANSLPTVAATSSSSPTTSLVITVPPESHSGDASTVQSGDAAECVPPQKKPFPTTSPKEDEQEESGCPGDKRRRQGSKSPNKSGLVRKKTITTKSQITSDQMLSICLPGYNWLEKKLHDVSKSEGQQDTQNESNTPASIESSVDTATRNSPIILQNPSFNDSSRSDAEGCETRAHVTAKRPGGALTPMSQLNRDPCNSNVRAKSSLGKEELIEIPDEEEPSCDWNECVIVDEEVGSEESVPPNPGDNEPILLPKIDTSTSDLPFEINGSNDNDDKPNNNSYSSTNHNNCDNSITFNNSINANIDDNDKSNTAKQQHTNSSNNNNNSAPTHDKNMKQSDTKQDDSQDDVVLLGVSPAKDVSNVFSPFNTFGNKTNHTMEENFIDLCCKRSEDIETPIHLRNMDRESPTTHYIAKNLELSDESSANRLEENLSGRIVSDNSKLMELNNDRKSLSAHLNSTFGVFNLERSIIAATEEQDKKEPKIYETCQLLYRKIQSIVTKSKSPEMSGTKPSQVETTHRNACRSLQDAINTAMVKAMGEDVDEEDHDLANVKPMANSTESFTTEKEKLKPIPQRPASSDQTHLPPKKRALAIEDSGTANVSNRSPPLSKRRKTTSRIQKVRPILLTEGEEEKCKDDVSIVKLPTVSIADSPAGESDVGSSALHPAWPGSSRAFAAAVQNSLNRPPTQQSGEMMPDLLKLNGLPGAWETLQTANTDAKLKTSMLMAVGKRSPQKKKVVRRVSHPEPNQANLLATPPGKPVATPGGHAATGGKHAELFYGDGEDGRFIHFKDGTVAFKEMRALQEPYSHSATNRYVQHVDLTVSSPGHTPTMAAPQQSVMAMTVPKSAWPAVSSHKGPSMEQPPFQHGRPLAMSRSPMSPHGTSDGSPPVGFFECLPSHRPQLMGPNTVWAPPKPKTSVPEGNLGESNAVLGHAFHPVTPSNKLTSYPRYHHPAKTCSASGHSAAQEAQRSVINPQPGALHQHHHHHQMIPMPAPMRPPSQVPFGRQSLGVPPPPPPPPHAPSHAHMQAQAQAHSRAQMLAGYQGMVSAPSWMPSLPSRGLATSMAHSQRSPYVHHGVPSKTGPSKEMLAHSHMGAPYDPRAAQLPRASPSETFSGPGQMLASQFAGATAAAAAAAAAMYQPQRQVMPSSHTPDPSQVSPFWSGASQHPMTTAPPYPKQ